MAAAAEYALITTIVGVAITGAVIAIVPDGVVNVNLAPLKSDGWTSTELISLGGLGLGIVTTFSGIYFAWRADRRATRELEHRIAKLEEQVERE